MFIYAFLLLGIKLVLVAASALPQPGFLHSEVSRQQVSSDRRLLKRQADFYTTLTQSKDKNEYLINITIGTPPQDLAVTLDTGSADLWIPAKSSKPCRQGKCDGGSFDPSKSSTYDIIDRGGFNITYAGPGDSDAGDWVQESLTVGGSRTVSNTIIGVALEGADYHGVMGVGFDTNEATPNPSANGTYPSVLDHMMSQGLINRRAYGLYLNNLDQDTGSMCFGCVDTTKYTGDLVALPLQLGSPGTGPDGSDPTEPNAFYVTLTEVTFNDNTGASQVLTPNNYAQSVILDSGTSETLLTNDVFSAIANGLGATYVGESEFAVPCSYSNTNASITYVFGGKNGPSVTVPLSEIIQGMIIAPLNFDKASGACSMGISYPIEGQVILGDTFLRSAYVVYDIDNFSVAIAQAAPRKISTSSLVVIPTGTSLPGVTSTATATGTQLDEVAAESTPFYTTATGKTTTAGTPTFLLGAAATTSGAKASGATTVTGNFALPTRAPVVGLAGAGMVVAALLI